MIKASESKLSNRIKCSICRVTIKDRHELYQSSLKLGVICKSCRERFSEDDIEMIVNLFFAFGGYFGQFDKSKFSMEEAIKDFAKGLGVEKSTFHLQNVMLWHKVLTHGIAPKEFLEELSGYADQKL